MWRVTVPSLNMRCVRVARKNVSCTDSVPCCLQLLSNHGLLQARPAQHIFETPSHDAAIPRHDDAVEA